jgi:hypothetical protein
MLAMRYDNDMARLRFAAVLFAGIAAVAINAASDNYVLNGNFGQGRDHWNGDGVVISDPGTKKDRVLKMTLNDYSKGISQALTMLPSTTALVGGCRVRILSEISSKC